MSDNPDQTPHGRPVCGDPDHRHLGPCGLYSRRRPDAPETHARAREWRIVGVPYETMSDSEALRCVLPAVDESLLAELGLVQAPECDTCGGWRVGCMHEGRFSPQHCADATVACPTCGGSGFKRLVALDGIDVEALREALRQFTSFRPGVRMDSEQMMVDAVGQVLAALDGEGEA